MKHLKQLRLEKGKTQKELAEYLNVSQQTVSRYENQKVISIPSDLLEKLAQYYGVSIDFILSENPKQSLFNYEEIEFEILEVIKCLDSYNRETLLIMGKRLLEYQKRDKRGRRMGGVNDRKN